MSILNIKEYTADHIDSIDFNKFDKNPPETIFSKSARISFFLTLNSFFDF